jgi:diguanylate cyclase (GGDEF)-like protein
MPLPIPISDAAALYLEETGALLIGLVFLFLYRQSRVVYFGLWAAAWGLKAIAVVMGYQLLHTHHSGWVAPHATFEFAFAIVLIAAGRAGFASSAHDWRTFLRLISVLPALVALVFAFGLRARMDAYSAVGTLVETCAYGYNFFALRHNRGVGAHVFRATLVLLAAALLSEAIAVEYFYYTGAAPSWLGLLPRGAAVYLLPSVLAFAAMAMWSESQIDRLRDLATEADHLRRAGAGGLDLDYLTGLLNQAALARAVEQQTEYSGVVAVCDMDNFKDINDRYGHLVGDEILRNVGSLLRASIRHEDEAFRWGGDEFVVLFHNQRLDVATLRMAAIEARLRDFQVRGHGMLPISFSWGTAEGNGRHLRDALDEADRTMYALKRTRPAPGGEQRAAGRPPR